MSTYHIQIRGQVDEVEINVMSPLEMRVVGEKTAVSSTIIVYTDQSGLIGLLRHLHGLGYDFLSMNRKEGISRPQFIFFVRRFHRFRRLNS